MMLSVLTVACQLCPAQAGWLWSARHTTSLIRGVDQIIVAKTDPVSGCTWKVWHMLLWDQGSCGQMINV